MTAKKPPAPLDAKIHPQLSYRLSDPLAVHCTGLAPVQQLVAAEQGDLAGEVPTRLTSAPKAPFIWVGQQLLNIQTARITKARAEAERRVAARNA
jgi:hypothetical protein